MTYDEANAKYWEPIFEDAIRKVAPGSSQIYSKLIIGLQAQADLAERKCEEMAAELATLKQRKMAGSKFMTSDFWWVVAFVSFVELVYWIGVFVGSYGACK